MGNEKNWIWIAAIALLAVVLIAAYWFYWHRRRKPTAPQTEAPEGEIPMDELARALKRFGGNFGALWRVARGQTHNAQTVFANIDVTVRYADSAPLQQWWAAFGAERENWDDKQASRKANALLSLFARCGLEMGSTGNITVDKDTQSLYVLLEEGELTPGETVNVVLPCWKYKDIVIEKGLITKEQTL